MLSNKDKVRKLLKGIETGDPDAASVVNENKYIQHNPHTREGNIGLAVYQGVRDLENQLIPTKSKF